MAGLASRRLIAKKLVDLLENGESAKHIAEVLAAYLVENRLTRSSELFLRDIRSEIDRRFSLMSVEVSSAKELSERLENEIADFIKTQTGAQKVEIISTVNPELVSGVVISTTEAEYDGSLRNKIKKLRTI